MVLQVPPYPLALGHPRQLGIMLVERLGADAGEHEQLRGAEGTGAEDDFLACSQQRTTVRLLAQSQPKPTVAALTGEDGCWLLLRTPDDGTRTD